MSWIGSKSKSSGRSNGEKKGVSGEPPAGDGAAPAGVVTMGGTTGFFPFGSFGSTGVAGGELLDGPAVGVDGTVDGVDGVERFGSVEVS